MTAHPSPIAICGAGAFGSALAHILTAGGKPALLYGRNLQDSAAVQRASSPDRHGLLETTSNIDRVGGSKLVLMTVPAQSMREVAGAIAPYLDQETAIVNCAKGIESGTGRLMSEVLSEALPDRAVAVLSGPGFAAEIAAGLPTAMTIAAQSDDRAADLAARLSTSRLRLYASSDLIGVQWGGALKNVLAIAAGIAAGKALGKSAEAALITRGFAEMQRLSLAFGARPETLSGLSGLGDLILTCSSPQSRNYAFGMALGSGEREDENILVEGIATAHIAAELATAHAIDAPVTAAISAILNGKADIDSTIDDLLNRPLRRESMG